MKTSTKALLMMGLKATQVLGRAVPRDTNPEVHASDDASNEVVAQNASTHNFPKAPPTNLTDPFAAAAASVGGGTELLLPPAGKKTAFNFFDLNNTLEIAELPDKKEWVIPVSHSHCGHWDVKDVNARGSIQQIVVWNDEGHTVSDKFVHWELDGMAGAFVCNCKWQVRDKAPASEMWEFYERIITWCGEGRSGWIFSKKWEKGWALATRDMIQYVTPKKYLCPWYCAFDPHSGKFIE